MIAAGQCTAEQLHRQRLRVHAHAGAEEGAPTDTDCGHHPVVAGTVCRVRQAKPGDVSSKHPTQMRIMGSRCNVRRYTDSRCRPGGEEWQRLTDADGLIIPIQARPNGRARGLELRGNDTRAAHE